MSLIDSLYILDSQGTPLVFKNYKQSNDRALIKEFYSEYNKHKERSETQYPIMNIKDIYFTYLTMADCVFVTSFSNDVQVLLVINCMQALITILKNILGEDIMSEGIKENTHKLALVLDHLMDYGYPLLTEKFAMEQLFKKDKIMQKIETTIINPLRNAKEGDSLEKFVDSMGDIRQEKWSVNRPSVNDEILFDLVEYVDCIIDKNGNIVNSEVYGEIKVNSMVPESTELNLYMQMPTPLADFSIHECLYDTFEGFERDKMLNFKVPQGNFTLLSYKPEVVAPRVPLDIIPSIKTLGNDELKIDLKIQASMVRGTFYRLYDINAKIFLPSEVKVKESSSKGLLKINEKDSTILWKIGEFDKIQDVSASFLLGMNGKTLEELSKIVLCLKFQIDSYSFSGTKIEKATFRDQDVKYTKKARSLSKSGFYEIRLN